MGWMLPTGAAEGDGEGDGVGVGAGPVETLGSTIGRIAKADPRVYSFELDNGKEGLIMF